MYIKRFVKHYYIMLVPAFLWLLETVSSFV